MIATNGLLLVDKPPGLSSNRVVGIIKKNYALKKVGHCGTLDPFASGLLILVIGQATRLQSYLMNSNKTYQVKFMFGQTTDTLDITGKHTAITTNIPTLEEIKRVVEEQFLGEIEQVPPAYSALHVNGKRAYQLAREGKDFDLPKRKIIIHSFAIQDYSPPLLSCEIQCSKGTYIRSIGSDLAVKLGSLAYTFSLRRTQSGCFHLSQSIPFTEVNNSHVKSMSEVVEALGEEVHKVPIEEKDIAKLSNGHYAHLKRHFKAEPSAHEEPSARDSSLKKKKLNALYIDEECVGLIDYIDGQVKNIYNQYA